MGKRTKAKNCKTAIVCAYRDPEPDRVATLESAAASIGFGGVLYAVEDKDASGPGYNRDRGIMAAADCDVVVLIDAHMRFAPRALASMANEVRANGGLLTALCHHNERCEIGGTFYSGGRMVWRSDDHSPKYSPLCAKWRKESGPGPATAVMGACYVFRRDWYIAAGRPLAMLRAWGCDEEALSIAAWMTGQKIAVADQHVAHLYRARPPFTVTERDERMVRENRAALCQAFIVEANARREQIAWAMRGLGMMQPATLAAHDDIERVRLAMLRAPRSFEQWRREVCEPEIIGGNQAAAAPASSTPRRHIANPVVPRYGIRCGHCQTVHDYGLAVQNTYPNGNRRHICPVCSLPFVSVPVTPPRIATA